MSKKLVPASSSNGGEMYDDDDSFEEEQHTTNVNGNGNENGFHIPPTASPVPDNYSSIVACPHIKSVLESRAKETVFVTYRQAVTISQPLNPTQTFISNKDGQEVSFDKLLAKQVASLKCTDCHLNHFQNSMICLQCPHVGCFGSHNHAMLHYKSTQHLFAIDSRSGLLYCFSCGNYTNHSALEEIRSEIMGNGGTNNVVYNEENYSDPNEVSINALKGFVNLGATCFMSSILQTLIHNPIVKYQFFNNDLHYFNCERNRLQYMNGGVIEENNACITCSVDSIFQYFFSNSSTEGFGMTNLLTTSWYKKKSLAGFQEQDAHEFWQFLLNEFHSDLQRVMGRPSLPALNDNNQCKCITHTTFSFELQSSIKCASCDQITETIDPMIDLSLEIKNSQNKQIDIYDCLDLFTSEEKLDILYTCNFCGDKTKPTKRLRLKSIPPVLSIQLKRFEHKNDSTSKIETPVSIPLFLDLTKYCDGENTDSIDGNKVFELFAVVCHIGSVNTGHYIVYIKDGNGRWFMYDDSVISLVSQQDVTNKNAYLLYYITHKI
ncbi:uncharacterized protein SPAPADRAFT_149886 [Spathaspora passalidarum NRRL Y-27907]|uniref:Ubiquitin carboxyl-terminal hydrolase n=1 Tax=Spathaspora passalidarum (strain NRRL Y-27907 / 11-Y1) TaxID=619300 RepID=G3AM36_SPAPN|nr:uncharacterized protein SPAPADRAFT_149886 [Spathaspora passalidarum NRRL Y-27907]EGW32741.1 hypothetical protein SPAPADRAFT_149886 [Spathaspora passalidarum NRRL Y-27907]